MTTLLYLHGVGDDGTRRDWWESLLSATQLPEDITLVAPDFSDVLGVKKPFLEMLPQFPRTRDTVPAEQSMRRYRAAQADWQSTLLSAGSTSVWPYRRRGFARVPGVLDAIGERLVTGVIFDEVGRYLNDEHRRRVVLRRVLAALPDSGRVIIVGHSLGALVALDLVLHLPDTIEVPLLVTAASALARRKLPPDVADLSTHFPYGRVGGWINVFNPADAVTRGLPIGMRFPQAIDVIVDGPFGDHNLTTCLEDPGVSAAIQKASGEHMPRPASVEPVAMLEREEALQLISMQVAFRMEQLLAEADATTVETLAQFAEVRRMAGERAALRTTVPDWDVDHALTLWHGVSERDLPAVLVHLAGVNPFAPLAIAIPGDLDATARRQVAVDLGVPPSWVDVATAALVSAAAVFKPRRRRGADDEADGEPIDTREAASISESVRQSLRSVAIPDDIGPSQFAHGLGDIRPACVELLARAITAKQLGSPQPGTEERTVLSRLMVVLGDHRARMLGQDSPPQRLITELRRRTTTVGTSLSWLADQGLGLSPAR